MRRGLILAALLIVGLAAIADAQALVGMPLTETALYTRRSLTRTAVWDTIQITRVDGENRWAPPQLEITFACSSITATADSQARVTIYKIKGGKRVHYYTGILDSVTLKSPLQIGWRGQSVLLNVDCDSLAFRSHNPRATSVIASTSYRRIVKKN